VLASHFTPEVFEKSQKYGKDKAKLAFVAGLYKQCIESALLHYGFYAWAWGVAGCALAKFGYSADYEANPWLLCRVKRVLTICAFPHTDFPICRIRNAHSYHFVYPFPSRLRLSNLRR
jgi:CAAX prenyl protease N-terminal, five membrane helices